MFAAIFVCRFNRWILMLLDFYSERLTQNDLKSIANALNIHFGTMDWSVVQAAKDDEVWDSFYQRVFCHTEYQIGDYANQGTVRVYAYRDFYRVDGLHESFAK